MGNQTDSRALREWLAVATKGLCGPAVARVEAESTAIYQAAAADAETRGLAAAHAHAMTVLGTPRRARRRFRREHLTWYEAQYVGGFIAEDFSFGIGLQAVLLGSVPYFFCFMLVIGMLVYAKLYRYWYLAGISLAVPSLLFFGLLFQKGRRWFRGRVEVRKRILLAVGLDVAIWTVFCGVSFAGDLALYVEEPGEYATIALASPTLWLFLPVLAHSLVINARLLRKLLGDRQDQIWAEARETFPASVRPHGA